jgi:hypothetical protein
MYSECPHTPISTWVPKLTPRHRQRSSLHATVSNSGLTFRRPSFAFRFFQSCLRPQHPCGVLELNLNTHGYVQGCFSFDSFGLPRISAPSHGKFVLRTKPSTMPAIIHLAASCCCGCRFSLTQFVYICICGTDHLTITGREGTVQIYPSRIGNLLHPALAGDIASED